MYRQAASIGGSVSAGEPAGYGLGNPFNASQTLAAIVYTQHIIPMTLDVALGWASDMRLCNCRQIVERESGSLDYLRDIFVCSH